MTGSQLEQAPDSGSRRWRAAGRGRLALRAVATASLIMAPPVAATPPRFDHWIDGTAAGEPTLQVQMIDSDTAVIRQSVLTNFEAPFLYLLFGRDRALLLDTGAGGLSVRPTVDRLIADWRQHHGGRPLSLVVAHSHGHGDHHAGDAEFRDRPGTVVVGLAADQVAAFFGIADWPRGAGRYDLGGRVLQVIPTPGHEPSHIMIYDPATQLLFSGDMLYPGRLYVPTERFAEYRDSTERLVAFSRSHRIRALLGAHIEMTRLPGQDFPMRAASHPSEHDLPLAPEVIGELSKALADAAVPPVIDRHADFIVYPRPPRPAR
ncbi:MBL fold metallo-hydrolase [Sphingomonas sp. 1P08PE]|uniref:MBL fold metallo-hydrolase n=1 Tax=Sphingomonas sp. 1P08PE TaxID=554122 RepID=UPI0039A29FB0